MKLKSIALATWGIVSTLTFAAEPDTQVIEYYHPELRHYFITASASDARVVDTGGAGAGWVRTGRSFNAWSSRDVASANATMVHRFYSQMANSHVYVASDDDLNLLKRLEASERAAIAGTGKTFMGWGYEGEAFLAVLPTNGQCPAATTAITRIYNQGFTSGEGSNHRFVSDDSLAASMEDRDWKNEGAVFCAPEAAGSAALASVAQAASSAAASASSYSGSVTFKYEEVGKAEVKSHAVLTLALGAGGSITGSGAGCNLSGSIVAKNASATLRGGSLIATGCTDTRFNGNYSRVEIEQFGASAIDVRFVSGDNTKEASIEGVLSAAAASGGTPTAPSVSTPSNIATAAGDFAGILAVLVTERLSGQAEKVVLNVNQPVTLKVSSGGVVSGSVQGCTVNGNLMADVNNRFTGSIVLSGCSEARVNGTYVASAHVEDGGAVQIELERESEVGGLRTKVSIAGNLTRSAASGSTTTTTIPPTLPGTSAGGIAIAGSFSGTANFLATRRPAGGREVTEVDKNLSLSLLVGSTGNVSGSGAGCNIAGSLAVSDATLGIFSGTVNASGCTDGIVNGSYTITATRQDASSVEFELERETEISGERVKVKIKGKLSK